MQFKQSTITSLAGGACLGLAMLLGGGLVYARYATQGEGTALNQQAQFKQLGIDLANASDYLTNEARLYVQTTDPKHLMLYWYEINVTRTRDNVLSGLKSLGATEPEFDLLATSKKNSDALVGTESRAMRLVLEANGTPEAAMPPAVASYKLSELDKALSNPDKLLTARRIMFDEQYAQDKSIIMDPVAEFQQMMNARAEATALAASDRTQLAFNTLLALVVVAVLGMFAVLWVLHAQLGSPVRRYISVLRKRNSDDSTLALAPAGTHELRELAQAFNEQTHSQQLLLEHNKQLVARLEERTGQAEQLVGQLQVQISERREVEQQLRIRERAMASSTTAIVINDLLADGYPIVYVNPAFERLTGYSARDMITRQLEVLVGPQTGQLEAAELKGAMRAGRETAVTSVCYRQDRTTFWAELTLAPVRDGNGPVSHCVTLLNDVSERKQAEQQGEALARTEKLRALGQMASGIAHDLNQSLMLIASYGTLGRSALEDDGSPDRDELREMFTVVTQAAMEGGDTVKRLLLLARAPLSDSEPIDLTLLVRAVVQLTAPRWRDAAQGEGRPIRVDVETTGHPVVIGSPSALRDALMNLILNAVDALPTGGRILVRCAQREDQALVEITDDGIGMSPDVQSKMFEPFFTTKGERGTGLGLATVFGVVERHAGQVQVNSEMGAGTTFHLSFPLSNLPVEIQESPTARTASEVKPQRRLRILAVDDEPALTKAVVRLLRPAGHQVTTAISGEDALGHLGQQAFDVVLSDVGMGEGMSGWELAERVRMSWPGVHFVLATGWGAGIDPVEARNRGVAAVLAKPYTLAELTGVLAAA